jgi:hypothetical protein
MEMDMKAKIIQENLIRDSCGYYWSYGGGNIRCVGDDDEQAGYPCESFKAGVRLLILYEFIDKSEAAAVERQLEQT